ncbi:hypothetical protein ACFL35_02200 [Candidatus Riflebacteria bacterium]
MRIVSRRKFLKGLAYGITLSSLPFTSGLTEAGVKLALGGSNSDYPKIVRGVYDWYGKNFFNFDKYFGSQEKEYIQACIRMMDTPHYAINNNFSYSYFAFSHRVKKEKINSGRTAFGNLKYRKKLLPLIEKLVTKWGVKSSNLPDFDNAFGLGWDVEEDHLKVYMFIQNWNDVSDPGLINLIKLAGREPIYDLGLVSVTLKGGKVVEKKVYLALKNTHPEIVQDYPFKNAIAHTNYMITDTRGIIPQVDIGFPFDMKSINSVGQKIVSTYMDGLRLGLDTIAYQGAEQYTLYFP